MSGGEIAQIILSVATLLTAAAAAFVSLRASLKVDGVATKVEEVRHLTNSMSTKLQEQAGELGEAKGRQDRRREERAEKVADNERGGA